MSDKSLGYIYQSPLSYNNKISLFNVYITLENFYQTASKSCHQYQQSKDIENLILKDAVSISDAGRFYLNGLIHKIDYMYFMKDDINWIKNPHFEPAQLRTSRFEKFLNTLKALIDLMRLEYDMLERISIMQTNKGVNFINEYKTNFSAIKIGFDTVAFTRVMYRSMLRYINWNLESSQENEKVTKVNQLKQDIDNILEEKNELEKAFLPN